VPLHENTRGELVGSKRQTDPRREKVELTPAPVV